MKIVVISDSSHTQALCREVVLEAFGGTVTLQCVSSPLAKLEADLYFWDIVPEPGIIANVAPEDNWRHFFFIENSEVEPFRAAFSHVTPNILLKPVRCKPIAITFCSA